jgi:hypothetical protein
LPKTVRGVSSYQKGCHAMGKHLSSLLPVGSPDVCGTRAEARIIVGFGTDVECSAEAVLALVRVRVRVIIVYC